MFESSTLKVAFNPPGHFYLSGHIDDSFPRDLNSAMVPDLIHLDFHDVKYMNSVGIMKFISFLNHLPQSVCLYYERVPAIVVSQMGLVKGIIGPRFKMKSFYVPYIDKDSKEQLMILLTIEEVINHSLPFKKHPQTGSLLEPDVEGERFLNFLNH